MKKYFKIFSQDARFARMLELELFDIGAEKFTDNTIFSNDDEKYVVIDLDSFALRDIEKYILNSTVVGFSQSYSNDLSEASQYCSVVLRRPFPTEEFLSVFSKSGNYKVVERKSKPIFLGKKTTYLTIDATDKCAVWGDTRITLSENEYKVLALLCENRGETVERKSIDKLLDSDESNMGDVYICHLRRKIDNSLGLKLIYTIRGKGYMLKN